MSISLLQSGSGINLAQPVNWNSPLNRGLVSWWLNLPGRRRSGLTFRDLCNRNHGTLTNMTPGLAWEGATGRPGGWGGIKHDGSNDRIACGTNSIFGVQNTFSATVWVKTSSGGSFTAVFGRETDGNNSWGFWVPTSSDPSYISLRVRQAAIEYKKKTVANLLPFNQWHQIGFSYNTGTIALYMDGVSYSTEDDGAGIFVGDTGTFYIGDSSGAVAYGDGTTSFSGTLDDARFYNRVLADSEFAKLYRDSRQGYHTTLNRIKRNWVSVPAAPAGTPSGGMLWFPKKSLNYSQPVNWSNPLNRGLVGWWLNLPGRRDSAHTLRDLCKHNPVTFTGNTWQGGNSRSGGYGSLELISASSQYGTYDSSSSLSLSGEMTVSCWLKTNSIARQGIIGSGDAGSGINNWYLAIEAFASNNIRFGQGGNYVYFDGYTVTTGVWYHITVVRTGTTGSWTWSLYVNGVFAQSYTGDWDPWGTTLTGYVGAFNTTQNYFNGNLDDIKVHNRALSASQIYRIYQESRRGYPNTLNWNRRMLVGGVSAAAGVTYPRLERGTRGLNRGLCIGSAV